jgi:hypothetical protein
MEETAAIISHPGCSAAIFISPMGGELFTRSGGRLLYEQSASRDKGPTGYHLGNRHQNLRRD